MNQAWWYDLLPNHPSKSELAGHKCGAKDMLMVVSYDICEPKRLSRVAKLCLDYGFRIQYSVFECHLQADKFDDFWANLLLLIDPSEDRVTAFRVCNTCVQQTRDAGVQEHLQRAVAYVF